jgi:hypothetical protein
MNGINLIDEADAMTPAQCMAEADKQFAMAEITNAWCRWAYERGWWFMLLCAEAAAGVRETGNG